jgi:ArsR family transcriptional regulator, arsenate/arsenite/antimonite-responsive transcriptional repressor
MLEELGKIFKSLSDQNRIRILKMLQKKSLCVCEIQAVLKLAVSTVSKHLSILREAGFITDWKEGKWINYQINPAPSQVVSNALLFVQMQMEEDETIKKDRKITCCVDRNILCCK